MHPIFIAHGPAFKTGFKIEPFKNVDLYPLMCKILGVEPAVHNGTIVNVIEILADQGLFFKYNIGLIDFFLNWSVQSEFFLT
jgi:hypothetical protein